MGDNAPEAEWIEYAVYEWSPGVVPKDFVTSTSTVSLFRTLSDAQDFIRRRRSFNFGQYLQLRERKICERILQGAIDTAD